MKTRASATSSVKLKCESCALGVQANDQALRGMFFTEPALLNRQHLSDLPRPLAGLSFRLGVAAGLASVAVVDDDDFQALRCVVQMYTNVWCLMSVGYNVRAYSLQTHSQSHCPRLRSASPPSCAR